MSSSADSSAAAATALSGAATIAALTGAATMPAAATEFAASTEFSAPLSLADPLGSGAHVVGPTTHVLPFLSTLLQGGPASTPLMTRSTGALFSGSTSSAPPGSPALRPNYGALAPYTPSLYAYDPATYGAFYGAPYSAPYGVHYGVGLGAPPGAGYGAPYGSGYTAFPRLPSHPPPVPPAALQSSLAVDVASSSAAVVPPYNFALDVITTPPFYFSNLLPVKLKMDHYLFWRAQILPLLRSHYLEGFVDGTFPCSSPDHHMY